MFYATSLQDHPGKPSLHAQFLRILSGMMGTGVAAFLSGLLVLCMLGFASQAHAGNNAQFVSQSIPGTMQPGETALITLKMKNTGTTTWTQDGNYYLGSENYRDNTLWGKKRIPLGSSYVAPGEVGLFVFSISPPASGGAVNFQWRMVQEGVEWFGDLSPNKGYEFPIPPPPPPAPGDPALPEVTMLSPNLNSTVQGGEYTGTVTVSGQAVGGLPIIMMFVHNGAGIAHSNTNSPTISFPMKLESGKTHSIAIRAVDSGYREHIVRTNVYVAKPGLPVATLSSPVKYGTYYLSGNAPNVRVISRGMGSGGLGVVKLELMDLTTRVLATFNSDNVNQMVYLPKGLYQLWMRATDSSGQVSVLTALSEISVTDTPPPTIDFTGPAAGTTFYAVNGIAQVRVTATATAMGSQQINKVEILNGDVVLAAMGTVPLIDKTVNVPVGSQNLFIRVTDSLGQTVTSPARAIKVVEAFAGDMAKFISQGAPRVLRAGQPYNMDVTMQNNGTTTWELGTVAGAGYKLGSQNPSDTRLWNNVGASMLPGPIPPGREVTFIPPIVAPSTPGKYNLQWQMVNAAGQPFGEPTPNVLVEVISGSGPTVELSATPTNARVAANGISIITLHVEAKGNGRKISKLKIFRAGASGYLNDPVHEMDVATEALSIDIPQSLGGGSWRFKARVTDDLGASTDSEGALVNVVNSALLGEVSGVRLNAAGDPQLVGWACESLGPILRYQVMVDAPTTALGGTLLTTGEANVSTEPDSAAISATCRSPGMGRNFVVNLAPYTASHAGRQLFVGAFIPKVAVPVILPCKENHCTIPGSLRIGLTTPLNNDKYPAPGPVFMRARMTNGVGPYDEVSFSINGEWIKGELDTEPNTYYASKTGLTASATPIPVVARVRKGNTTLYSTTSMITITGAPTAFLTLTSPQNGAVIGNGEKVSLSATATGQTVNIASVKFFLNGRVIATGNNANGTWTAMPMVVPNGKLQFAAGGYNGSGVLVTMSPISTVTVSGSPIETRPIPVDITPPHLDNQDAGTLPGSLTVGKNGNAEYVVPLAVPPGTGGMAPSLTLNYSSEGSNGMLGLGWSLGGLTTINRCPKTIAQDGVPGRISFDNADRLCINGQRLVRSDGANPGTDVAAIDAAYWAAGAQYRTELESFSRFTRLPNGGFLMEAKDGLKHYYGTSTGNAIAQPNGKAGQPLLWALARTEDRHSNYMTVEYNQDGVTGEYTPKQIRYGANTAAGQSADLAVRFAYEARSDAQIQYIGGGRNDLRSRLMKVSTFTDTAADGSGGALVRDHRLNYTHSVNSGRSMLESMEACAINPGTGARECLPKTTFEWGIAPAPSFQQIGSFPPPHMPSTYLQKHFEGDLHGNGRSSFISTMTAKKCEGDCDKKVGGHRDVDMTAAHTVMTGPIRILMPDGTIVNRTLKLPELTTALIFGDINGDGRDDIVAGSNYPGAASAQAYCLNIIARDGNVDFDCRNWNWETLGGFPKLVAVNNDRKKHILFGLVTDCHYSDLIDSIKCIQRKVVHSKPAAPHYGSINDKSFFNPASVSVGRNDISDFYSVWNNRGGNDSWDRSYVITTYQGVTVCWNREIILCDTVFDEYQPGATTSLVKLGSSKATGDINGDGLDDFLYWGGGTGLGNGTTVCLSKETGIDCQHAKAGGDLGDYLGDGMTYAFGGTSDAPALCRYSDGTFVCQKIANARPPLSREIQLNYNGDGVLDMSDHNAITRTVWTLAGPAWQDKIRAVTNGLGRRDEVEYARADDADVYRSFDAIPTATSPGDIYANSQLPPAYPLVPTTPGVMVKQLRQSNGKGGWLRTNYRYKGAVADASGRGSSGFNTVWSTDVQTGIVTATTYNQAFPFTGMPMRSSTTTPAFVIVNNTEMLNEKQAVNHTNGAQTSVVYAKKSVTKKRDLDGSDLGLATVTSHYTDGWGNPNQEDSEVTGTGGTFTTSVVRQFINDSAAWLLGKSTLETQTRKGADGVSLTRTVAYGHHPATGALTTKTVEPNAPVYRVVTTYDRTGNVFGHVNQQIETWQQPGCVPPAPCSSTRTVSDTRFDAKGRFGLTVKNALGHQQSAEYYPGTGARKRQVDINGLITTSTADGFGRINEERLPDGTSTRTYVKLCNGGCPADAVAAQVSDSFNGLNRIRAPFVTYLNSAGKSVGTLTWGLDGVTPRAIITSTRFDDRMRPVEVDHPRFENAPAYLASRTNYDDLNRPFSVVTMDEAGAQHSTTTVYNGAISTLTNALKQTRVETKNVLGQLISVRDPKNKTTSFEYEPFGNLSKTVDPAGNVIRVGYDLLGRKKSLVDPDLGTITYNVDPVGRVYRQQNPLQKQRGQQTTLVYDALDRMTQRLEPDLSSYWIFDTAARGVGKLAEAYTMTGSAKDYRRVHTYDHMGRRFLTTQTLTGSDYTVLSEYDEWGRPSVEAYTRGSSPSKRFITYYGKTGEVDRVQREAVVLMKIAAQDASRRVTEVVFGNGLTQKKNYNRYTGRLEDGSLQTSAGAARLTEGYQYDVIGSVTNRTHYWDNVGFQETFKYDELNRLSTSQVAGQSEQTFTYDDAGNLKTKSNVGGGSTYVYPAPGASAVRPHAVHNISGVGAFGYDANGNLLTGAGRTISWNSFDMPIQIGKGGITANFVYGPEHQRTRQNRSDGTSVVYAGAQEVESKANGELTVKTYWPQGIGVEIDIGSASTAFHWTHDDHLGSPIGISDQAGNLEEKLAYDAWGKRRSLTGGTVGQTIAGCGALPSGNVTPDCIDGKIDNRGYTGHEMLDQLDLVHMNGRVYDPLVARFLSGDPMITDPLNGQSYNRYSYVLNNPTNMTDPTGFDPNPRPKDSNPKIAPEPAPCAGKGGYCSVVYQNPGDSAGTASNKQQNKDGAQKADSSANAGGAGSASRDDIIREAMVSSPNRYVAQAASCHGNEGTCIAVGAAPLAGGWFAGTALGRAMLAFLGFGSEMQGMAEGVPRAGGSGSSAANGAAALAKTGAETVRVGRWMSPAEYQAMKLTGRMQEGAGGATSIATSGPASFAKQAPSGSVYVEFSVPKSSLLQGGQAEWFKVIGPNAPRSMQFMLQKQGGQQLPQVDNLSHIQAVKQ
ncbi:Ig-like domain-containing protein [Massilia sp. CCM 9210]|uniref:TreTu family toxin n=1 Tax=Massilia scottii TaxID=3057166 RepID=UPI00279678AD|nr:Ig-like domain-containing protein [Massilia sp. CCM 9210]MDQ1813295.1 Ig-like domain-containing protein [Massilia sp. CCM 9210]